MWRPYNSLREQQKCSIRCIKCGYCIIKCFYCTLSRFFVYRKTPYILKQRKSVHFFNHKPETNYHMNQIIAPNAVPPVVVICIQNCCKPFVAFFQIFFSFIHCSIKAAFQHYGENKICNKVPKRNIFCNSEFFFPVPLFCRRNFWVHMKWSIVHILILVKNPIPVKRIKKFQKALI